MCDFQEDLKKLATVSEMAKNNLDCDVELVELNQGDYLKYLSEFSFHPNGNTGCVLSNDDYMSGIRCDHLIWIQGCCEGVEKFWTEKDDEYRRFQTKLVPNIPADKVLGIRTPQMRMFIRISL